MNFKIKPNYWLNCVQCLKENKKFYFGNRRYLGIGVEIESNSLIVRCFKHNKNIKLYRLADEEIELMPEECDDAVMYLEIDMLKSAILVFSIFASLALYSFLKKNIDTSLIN